MEKKTIETFIKKYYLGGNIETVRWVVDAPNKTLSCNAITDDKNVLLKVTLKNFDVIKDSSTFGVFETAKLKSLLSVLTDSITLNLNKKDDGSVTSVLLNDVESEVQFVTADLSVVPESPKLKKMPDFGVEILIDKDWTDKFIRAKSALSEIDTYTLLMNKKGKLQLVIGYSKNTNANKVSLDVKTTDGKDKVTEPIHFSAKYLKEVLLANYEASSAVLNVSENGISTINFTTGDFESSYYLVAIKKDE